MPPVFSEKSFEFEDGQEVPDHADGSLSGYRDPSKYHLDGFDTFDGEAYPLANDIDNFPTAKMLCAARQRHLEITQPTSTIGGPGGVQDQTYIIEPRNN